MRVAAMLACVACVACGRVDLSRSAVAGDAAASTWRLVQVVAINNGDQVSIEPSSAGDLIVTAILDMNGDSVTSVGDGVDPTYTDIPGARVIRGGTTGALEMWYANQVAAGVRTITVHETAAVPHAVVVWEVANIRATDPIDTVNIASGTATTTGGAAGAEIATASAGEFVVSIIVAATTVTGIESGNEFTNDSLIVGGGWAHLADDHAPAGPQQAVWSVSAEGDCSSSAVAFFAAP
jgi:hypothetical protein